MSLMPTPTSTTWRMADHIAGGTLEETLTEIGQSDRTFDQMAVALRDRFPGVDVTGATVRNWLAALSDPERVA